MASVVAELKQGEGLVVDIATGRGTLLERLACELERPLAATDVSPTVLARTRTRLAGLGLGHRIAYVACDARRLPFRAASTAALTSFLGLANIQEPGRLLSELRRVAGGPLLAVTHFYPREDGENASAIRALGLERLLYRDALLAELAAAGWRADIRDARPADARPTPTGVLLEGAAIDGLPVAPTVLEWCVVTGERV
jgi:ubiquinone/menaquinone biosynthesis C-methylase UbiE